MSILQCSILESPSLGSVTACRSFPHVPVSGGILIKRAMFQEIAWNMKGEVTKHTHREYGFAQVQIDRVGEGSSGNALFEGLGDELQVRQACLKHASDTDIYPGMDVPRRPALGHAP